MAIQGGVGKRLRPARQVMRLARLGSFHRTRLSFMPALLRQLRQERWGFARPLWDVDAAGVGQALYTARGPRRTYSLVAFAHDLPADMRSDRVIATAWDCTFCLFDGIPDRHDLERLAAQVPKQEAGRLTDRELSLSRANRSVRLWDYVVDALAQGRQPEEAMIRKVGYLMRTTAVYGSGKFGAADRAVIKDRKVLALPFRAELLSVYLIRAFVMDLVEHCARAKGGDRAVALTPSLRRLFGIGNSTGLGMAPFLVNHPILLHAWIMAREQALARVRAVTRPTQEEREAFLQALDRTRADIHQWHCDHPLQKAKIADLRKDMGVLMRHCQTQGFDQVNPWDALIYWSEGHLTLEGQEQLVSLVIEPYGWLVDDLNASMSADEEAGFSINGGMHVKTLKGLIAKHYDWALAIDFSNRKENAKFWYVSQEKMEPRLGLRYEEPGSDMELPLGIARDMQALAHALEVYSPTRLVADFLLAKPQHRHVVRRVQFIERYPYAEIRDNLLAQSLNPLDLLRCKLSFFGATRFDPRSDRWLRICMYENEPFPYELQRGHHNNPSVHVV
ncbi:MAG: hypothetical protein AAF442_08515 [Pseudomonadota bacterium]